MIMLIPVVVLLALACIFLLVWCFGMRRRLRESLQGATVSRSVGAEESAILRAANERFESHNRRLQSCVDDLQQELAALSYSVSHDLRAPLRSIDGFSQALAEDYGPRLDATAQDYLKRVRTGALHLNRLIDELLEVSRVMWAPLRVEPVDLASLARQVAGELSATDPARRVEWKIPDAIVAQGDPGLLVTTLRQLLGNAWKFSSGRLVAQIGFRAVTSEHGAVVYEVRDNGAGFDMQYAGRLFGLFQRMHAAAEFPGQGMGLAMAQRIIRRHGGRIWAAAETGQGAIFSFTLDLGAEAFTKSVVDLSGLPSSDVSTSDAASLVEPRPSVA